jgi:hypothetical protein
MGARAIAVTAIVIAAVSACRSRRAQAPERLVDEADRFPHERHATLGCRECHTDGEQPGARDHAPCDRGECHAPVFQSAAGVAGSLCKVCHVSIDVTDAGDARLRPYPREGGIRALPAKFSHRTHLDAPAMERAVGFHVACGDCHPRQPDRDVPGAPGHVECARCHAPEVALARAPAMGDCAGCHVAGDRAARHRRRLITDDLHFDHRNHEADLTGSPIRCRVCHEGTVTATGRQDHAPPEVGDCVGCHDDAKRTPTDMRMRICETCHTTRSATIGAIAPRDHLPGTERPIDHTIAFRTDHDEPARRDAARCATCHTQLSGSTVDICDECHQVTRPTDHVVTWRELDHGGASLADGERCATCHVVDYCVACHRQRPRSHLTSLRFAELEHGDLARINPRSCLTCHEPASECSPCHPAGVFPP